MLGRSARLCFVNGIGIRAAENCRRMRLVCRRPLVEFRNTESVRIASGNNHVGQEPNLHERQNCLNIALADLYRIGDSDVVESRSWYRRGDRIN